MSSSTSGLDSYCNSTFWNETLTNAPTPQFTECFRQTAMVWGPCFFLWFFSIYHVLVLWNSKEPKLKCSWLHVAKLTMSGTIFILMVIQLSYRGYEANNSNHTYAQADYFTPAIVALTAVFALCMQIYSRFKGQVTSGVLWLFWFGFVLCQLISLISYIEDAVADELDSVFDFVIFILFYTCLLISFVLSSFAEPQEREENACPELFSSFLSQIMFWWFDPVIWMGYRKPLVYQDLWRLNARDRTKKIAPKLAHNWEIEMQKSRKSQVKNGIASTKQEPTVYVNATLENVVIEPKGKSYDMKEKYYKPSLTKAMFKTYGMTMLAAAFFKLGNDTIQFLSPTLLSLMINFTEDPSIYEWYGYFYAASMYAVTVTQAIFLNQYFHRCMLVGMNIRTAVISCVYKKALVISNSARKETTVGEIVNLMSTDAQRFMDLMSYIQIVWSGPYVIAISLYLLWQELGPSVMAGFVLMIVLIPINGVIASYMRKLSVNNMKLKDKRIKLMNEILNGVKVLKLYAWEPSFEQQVQEIRKQELILSKKSAYFRSVMYFLWTVAPFAVALVSFAVFVLIDDKNILDSETAFVSISLFNILRFPLVMLPSVISSVIQAQVSVKRLTKFLMSEEIDPTAVDRDPKTDNAIEIKNGFFSWQPQAECDLQDVNIEVKPGSLVAVVGHVGCGKSSLISAILGEMEKKDGYVGVKGSIAYVPQQAWIQNDTLVNNVLFGKTLQKDGDEIDDADDIVTKNKYRSIIRGTALGPDLEILPAGDQTEIGEKGINLSGGQKQRISLARAVCSDADVYLLDDPLSAVDSHIGKHIFDHVIGDHGLLKEKTRVLVTHGINYLPQVDNILVMQHGKISETGKYEELIKKGGDFSKFLEEYANKPDEGIEEDELALLIDDDLSSIPESRDTVDDGSSDSAVGDVMKEHDVAVLRRNASIRSSNRSTRSSVRSRKISSAKYTRQKSELDEVKENLRKKKLKELQEKEGKLTTTETSEEGKVKFKVYYEYMKSIGLTYSFLIIILCILYQGAYVGASVWLSVWSAENDNLGVNETNPNTEMRLGVYGVFGIGQAIFIMLNGFAQAIGTVNAAKMLQSRMLKNIMRVPVQFFDTTPLGRIVNRFAKDVYIVDEILPATIRMWLSCFFSAIATVALIIAATPIFAAVVVPIGILYFFAQRFYVATSRQLKRLESVTRSPIYSHFGETVSGVSLLRAFGHNERFILQSESKVDKNQECYYPNIVSNRWLSVRLEIVGNAIVFFAALSAVWSRGTISGSLAGLSISYALSVTMTLNWWVRQMSELETNIVAAERIREYAEVKNEAKWRIPRKKPPSEWPATGIVEFVDYGTRYREDLDLVLKNINCKVEQGKKVGIVGRTGAGKSSLTLALFRLIEAAEGKIKIDDVDISKIGLHDLRTKLTIIPQDPVLFSGTMRLNIDPFNKYSDDDIWDCLEHAHLKDFVSGLAEKLEYICAEGGENLSVGQRQLVCLARALLRKSKILVLDEATAAVDMQTDDLIQQTIRREFQECTVITIAHRLNTIMDYDQIMVLDTGKIVEFDSPQNLLKLQGVFYGMAKDAGLV